MLPSQLTSQEEHLQHPHPFIGFWFFFLTHFQKRFSTMAADILPVTCEYFVTSRSTLPGL